MAQSLPVVVDGSPSALKYENDNLNPQSAKHNKSWFCKTVEPSHLDLQCLPCCILINNIIQFE